MSPTHIVTGVLVGYVCLHSLQSEHPQRARFCCSRWECLSVDQTQAAEECVSREERAKDGQHREQRFVTIVLTVTSTL